jgi:hypothetical protein
MYSEMNDPIVLTVNKNQGKMTATLSLEKIPG